MITENVLFDGSKTPGYAITVPAGGLIPNVWNPNRMDSDMFAKAMASIRQFGFVDPITVRLLTHEQAAALGRDQAVDWYEIIDGEHRWKAGLKDDWQIDAEGKRYLAREAMTEFPCWSLGFLDDVIAQQLTIVLNETRGTADRSKLGDLIRKLSERRDERLLRDVMPFSADRFDAMVGIGKVDFDQLAERRKAVAANKERNVERVYRLPRSIADVWDDAVAKARTEGASTDAEAIEAIAMAFIS